MPSTINTVLPSTINTVIPSTINTVKEQQQKRPPQIKDKMVDTIRSCGITFNVC